MRFQALLLLLYCNVFATSTPVEVRHLHFSFGDAVGTVRMGFSTNRSEWPATFTSVCAYWPEQDEKAIAYAESDFVRTYNASVWKSPTALAWDLRFVDLVGLKASRYYVQCGIRDGKGGRLQLDAKTTTFDNVPPGAKWSFVAFGDLGVESSDSAEGKYAVGYTRKRVEDEVMNHSARFVLHYGDISYARSKDAIWDEFMDAIEPVASHVPWMVSPGNHDCQAPDSGNEDCVPFFARFWMPTQCSGNPYWYAFDYGGIHFVSLSTEHEGGNGSAQYLFLEEDLKKAAGKYSFIVVVGHRPLLSSHMDFGQKDALATALYKAWLPLFEQYHVDLTLWGHMHAYERIMMGNIPHITSGMAGQSYCCGAWDYNPPAWSIYREDSHGYLRIGVDSTSQTPSLQVDYIRSDDGTVRDTFTVKSRQAPTDTPAFDLRQGSSSASHLRYPGGAGCSEEAGASFAITPVVPPGLCPKASQHDADHAVLV